jgi:hypothetical protein
MDRPPIYGLMAEFNTPSEILEAAERAKKEGYTRMDAYSPFPVEGLSDALGFRRTLLPMLVFAGGVLGALTGFFMQYYASVIAYPENIGGRPLNSWPSFIPITFELTILFAGLTAVISMFILNGLPNPYFPTFNVPAFGRVTRDKFFLCIEAVDPRFDREQTKNFLESLHPKGVEVVEH